MASMFDKEVWRSITHSLGRFIAIAAIAALGVGFYAGLRMSCPDMKESADVYYDATHLMDIRVISTLGMSDDDVEFLSEVEGVSHAMPAYETDVVMEIQDSLRTARMHSLPDSAFESDTSDGLHAISDDDNYLNRLILAEGRWPQASDECLLLVDKVEEFQVALGETIMIREGLSDLDDTLTATEFTVVGLIHSPYYVCSTAMGTTSVGGGNIQQSIYVPEGAFAEDFPYTEVFLEVDGARDLKSGSAAYKAKVQEVLNRILEVAPECAAQRTASLKADAQEEIDEGWDEYNESKADAQRQLANSRKQLDDAAAAIAQGREELAENEAKLDDGQAQLDAAKEETYKQIDDAETELTEKLEEATDGLASANQALGSAKQALQQMIEAGVPEDDPQRMELEGTVRDLEATITRLEGLIPMLQAGLEQIPAQRAQADAEFAAKQEEIDAGREEIEKNRALLDESEEQYRDGLAAYESARAEANSALADAESELNDAQEQVDDIADAEWYVMDRTKNHGAFSYESDANRIDSIAAVFPFIFFLVAALVSLTTMTRMVEEERVLIGTYKALGYSRGRITSKYLIYAASACIIGGIIGIAILGYVLPLVIEVAYAIIYSIPRGPFPIDIPISLLSLGLGLAIVLGATWAAAAASLREKPASLMLPKAPPMGKRIFLEHIEPIWSRTSFSWKVTFRNLFRYKKRLIMTVIGIAGCTALLLTGLGLQNSINDIIDMHFGRIVHYNMAVIIEDDADDQTRADVDAYLAQSEYAGRSIWLASDSYLASTPNNGDVQFDVIVPEDPERWNEFVSLQDRTSGTTYSLDESGIIATEKLAHIMNVSAGQKFRMNEQDATGNLLPMSYDVPVGAIVEYYVFHNMFMTPAAYEEYLGEEPDYTRAYVDVTDDPEARQTMSDELKAIEGVRTVTFNDGTIDSYRTMLKSVNLVVIVLVVAAMALAFIVLYNLTNINITERKREIATLKVLGFTRREYNAYIFREVGLLSIMGALVGMVLGTFMESFVIVTAEVDQVMFGRVIHPESYAIAFGLTLLFTAIVLFTMRHKLAKIDMVESLKSIE